MFINEHAEPLKLWLGTVLIGQYILLCTKKYVSVSYCDLVTSKPKTALSIVSDFTLSGVGHKM